MDDGARARSDSALFDPRAACVLYTRAERDGRNANIAQAGGVLSEP
jgi:hypothetical protein